MTGVAGGWETWRWDESLFAGAAEYYERGRLPYAPGLAGALGRSLRLDGRGRLLDVGCRPGIVTLRLAGLFGERRGDFEADVREVLREASPSGRFSVRLPDNRLRI